MSTLRFALFLALAGATMVGCGDDGGRTTDAGPGTGDAGDGTDAGPGTGDAGDAVDAGGGGGTCPTGVCDIVGQTGCGAGEACYLNVRDPICQPAGTAGDGEACTAPTDCQEGFTCADGFCSHWCCPPSDDGCPTGQTCLIRLVDEMGMQIGAGLCRLPSACDPLTQMGCMNATDGCYIAGADGTVLCATAGTGMDGAMCDANNDCAAGFTCAGTDMVPTACRAICDTSAAMMPGCPMGYVCAGFMGPMPWGACIPMP